MPLSKCESKAILVNLFQLSLALSEKRTNDAVSAYSRILDYTLYDQSDELPSIIQPKQDEIDLIISEIRQEVPTAVPTLCPTINHAVSVEPTTSAPVSYSNMTSAIPVGLRRNFEDDLSDIDHAGSGDEFEEGEDVSEASDYEGDAEKAADKEVAEEEEEEAEEEEEEEEAEEEEEEEAEEEEELPLESVRIKKVFYWKNTDNGDIYKCLPDGELGEKVGKYVDDKPVFD
jgi:hypothetical protein